MADLIVLAGGVGIEMAAKKAGHKVNVPFLLEEVMQDKIRLIYIHLVYWNLMTMVLEIFKWWNFNRIVRRKVS